MKKLENLYFFQRDNFKIAITQKSINAKDISNLKSELIKYDFTVNNLTYATQVHSNDVFVAKKNTINNIGEYDALVTKNKNQPLLIFTADCVPVVFFDSVNAIVGLAHAGWRGTYENIVGGVVDIFVTEFGSKLENIEVLIGPYISKKWYNVSQELIEKFSTLNINNYFSFRDDNYYLDLGLINRELLVRSGIVEKNITDLNLCTVDNNDQFFSYRKDVGTDKRIGTIIELN